MKLSSSFLLCLFFGLVGFAEVNQSPLAFAAERKSALRLFDDYLNEVYRLDGDGLLPRGNRKFSHPQIAKHLRRDLQQAKTKMEIGRVFTRVDMAYTNLHAHVDLNPEYDFNTEGRPVIGANFQPEIILENGAVPRYLISNVRKEQFIHLDPENRPLVGDEIIAINQKSIKSWSDENFEYCKFPLRNKCETDFWDNFRKGNLSWFRRHPLVYTLKRSGRLLTVQIPVFARAETKDTSPSKENKPATCAAEKGLYAHFDLVYEGYRACVYENKNKPGVALLRIQNFKYKTGEFVNEIDRVSNEVERFAKKYWDKKSQLTQLLIIDVAENGGGDIITYWAAQFLDQPFQDAWVRFKKTKELDDPVWRKEAFYDDPGKRKVYEDLKASAKWSTIKDGEFIPAMPQFCYSTNGDCLKEKFIPQKGAYRGKIVILTSQWCISSCVGFVWTMKKYMKDRVQFAGMPDSGDSTYSRTYLEGALLKDDPGFKLSIFPRPALSRAVVGEGALFRSAISTSRSTDEDGNLISGIPMKMDFFVSPRWDENFDQWVGRTVNIVLAGAVQ